MQLKPITLAASDYPEALQPFLAGAALFDSSCSDRATVIYIAKNTGYFLKKSAPGSLKRESELTAYYHSLGLAARVVDYFSTAEYDYLLTEKVPGDDCTAKKYLSQPQRLCELLARQLAKLHDLEPVGCPVPDHTALFLARARQNFLSRHYDISLFPDNWGFHTAEDAFALIQDKGHLLQADTLLHDDFCLPNIILDDWGFSGLVELDSGGVGDRHVDLFWGAWSLAFNLKTDRYRQCFFAAYGKEKIDPEKLRLVAACEVFS